MEGLRYRPHRLLLDHDLTANGTRTRGSAGAYSSEANFDTNMVIILAALLCALICALGLNSIVRCALRCSRRLELGSADHTAARAAARGVKRSALRRIPVAVYGSDADIPATDCPICLGDFADGEKVRVLPRCRHGFHVGCIDTWLLSHSSCPNCRQSLLEPPAAAPPVEAAEEGSAGDGVRGQVGRGGGGDVAAGIDDVG